MAKTKKQTAKKVVKKIVKKPVAKKVTKKAIKPKESRKEKELSLALVVAENKAEELAERLNKALVVESKKSLVKPPFDLKVLLKMAERTPSQYVKQRKGPSGTMLSYVEGGYMRTVLNYLFGWRWNFEIMDKGEVKVGNKVVQVWVQGKLTIRNEKNEDVIIKTQFGGADVKYLKSNTSMPVDLPNDYKGAATDALKKCASELGIASDVYNKNDFIISGDNPKNIDVESENNVINGNEVEAEVEEVNDGVNYLGKLVTMLCKEANVKIEGDITKEQLNEIIELFNNYTGSDIKSLKVAQSTAKKYLLDFVNSPMMLNKK